MAHMINSTLCDAAMSNTKQKSNERRITSRDRKTGTGPGTGSNGAYNPISGTFHLIESISVDSGSGHLGGRFKSIDDDDNVSSNGGGTEFESMSNSGSWSGESEDQIHFNSKEKSSTKAVNQLDLDKREKVRVKNERKHQRQKERRAQELKDKCIGYLMSWKLEALSQQLVAMGFPKERATMALFLNDGHVERSVSWLLEGGGDTQIHEDWNTGGNLKIDVSEQLGCILEVEKKYKIPRPYIERAVISCKGDLESALELARASNRCASPVPEETHKPLGPNHIRVKEKSLVLEPHFLVVQTKGNGSLQSDNEGRSDKKFATVSNGQRSVNSRPCVEIKASDQSKNKLSKYMIDFQHTLSPSERKEHIQGNELLSVPTRTSSPNPEPAVRIENGFMGMSVSQLISTSVKNHVLKEPGASIGRSHPSIGTTTPSALPSTEFPISLSSLPDWNGELVALDLPLTVPYVNTTHMDSVGLKDNVAKRMMNLRAPDMQSGYNDMRFGLSQSLVSQYNRLNERPFVFSNAPKHIPASLGTSFNGLFSSCAVELSPNTSVDWSSGPMMNCDYRNIDWSMNTSVSTRQDVNLSSRLNTLSMQDQHQHYWKSENERKFDSGLHGTTDAFISGSPNIFHPDIHGSGRQGRHKIVSSELGNKNNEWTSPFAGKDLFNLPQVVPSPSL